MNLKTAVRNRGIDLGDRGAVYDGDTTRTSASAILQAALQELQAAGTGGGVIEISGPLALGSFQSLDLHGGSVWRAQNITIRGAGANAKIIPISGGSACQEIDNVNRLTVRDLSIIGRYPTGAPVRPDMKTVLYVTGCMEFRLENIRCSILSATDATLGSAFAAYGSGSLIRDCYFGGCEAAVAVLLFDHARWVTIRDTMFLDYDNEEAVTGISKTAAGTTNYWIWVKDWASTPYDQSAPGKFLAEGLYCDEAAGNIRVTPTQRGDTFALRDSFLCGSVHDLTMPACWVSNMDRVTIERTQWGRGAPGSVSSPIAMKFQNVGIIRIRSCSSRSETSPVNQIYTDASCPFLELDETTNFDVTNVNAATRVLYRSQGQGGFLTVAGGPPSWTPIISPTLVWDTTNHKWWAYDGAWRSSAAFT